MLPYIIKRLLLLPVLFILFSIITFALIQAPPGDFLTTYIATLAASGSNMDQAQMAALRQTYGLDQPLYIQYFKWLGNVLQGNLGISLEWQTPVVELIGEFLLLTIILSLTSFIFTWLLAIPIGIISATRQYSIFDYVFTVISYIGLATPNFMLALIVMWLALAYFGVNATGLFSAEYIAAPWSWGRVLDLLQHLWLPTIILGVGGMARLSRIVRANMLDELKKPYIEMARAKGLPEWRLILKYPTRLAFNPLVSTIGWYLPALLSGSLIVATVMNLPNIGPVLLRALITQDMYLAGALVLLYFLLTMIGTLISDILLAWLDPRIRLEEGV
jgi:peptide/nickel transport system permease protein